MSWNYRVIKHDEEDDENVYYGLHEVYYDEHQIINGWTEEALIVGDTKKEIKTVLKMMLVDVKRHEVLIYSELSNKQTISDILIRRISKHYEEHNKQPDKLELNREQIKELLTECPYGASPLEEASGTQPYKFMGVPIETIEVE